MTAIVATCRGCGAEFTPDRETIIRGEWKKCPACRPASVPPSGNGEGRCEKCGRALRAKGRTICLSCLGVPAL